MTVAKAKLNDLAEATARELPQKGYCALITHRMKLIFWKLSLWKCGNKACNYTYFQFFNCALNLWQAEFFLR